MQPPRVTVRHRPGDGGADVGAGGPFGHEHRALDLMLEVVGGQAGQVAFDQCGVGEVADRAGQCIGHADRAQQAELGLGEQVLDGVLRGVRHRMIEAEGRAVRHRRHGKLAVADPLHLGIGRMLFDPLSVAALAIARMQGRRVAVGAVRQLVKPPAYQISEALKGRPQGRKIGGRKVQGQQLLERLVIAVRVDAVGIGLPSFGIDGGP